MNPFKHKQLKEFTITDCELYISKYPYGEHLVEVKRHLRNLTKAQQDNPKKGTKTTATDKVSKPQSDNKRDSVNAESSTTQTSTSNDGLKTIFSVIVTLILTIIIVNILDEILPHTWRNYSYAFYAGGFALFRLVSELFGLK